MPHAYLQTEERFTPRQFFEESLPEILSADEASRLPPRTLTIRLFGEEAGAWTIDFAAKSVKPEIADMQDLLLEMDDVDFQSMMKGKLDIDAAILGGRIRRRGDLEVLAHLGVLLQDWSA